MSQPVVPFENVAEMLEQLGGIDPRRIRSWPPPGKATEKDVLALLDRENRLYELVDGILVEKVMGLKESALAMHLGRLLGNFVEEHDLGIVAGADGTLRLLSRLIRIPDIAFISWRQLPGRVYPSAPVPDLFPDLAVAVLSEGNTKAEMARKLKEYFLAGTHLVWFVAPDARTVTAYTSPDESALLTEADTLDGGNVLPGFRLAVARLFDRVPRTSAGRSKTGSAAGRRPKRGGRRRNSP